jgi:hypothetical protein
MWTGAMAANVRTGKTKLKKLWTDKYKKADALAVVAPPKVSFLEEILNRVAPTSDNAVPTATSQHDQLWLYLDEPPNTQLGLMEYWNSREAKWPQLARMAYDFLAIPAMSSECERVFSSVSKQTTPESSRLTGELLWHQECLSNWQRRGAIRMEGAFNAVLLDLT